MCWFNGVGFVMIVQDFVWGLGRKTLRRAATPASSANATLLRDFGYLGLRRKDRDLEKGV